MSSPKHLHKTSKFLSYILRHKPEAIGLILNENGWAIIDELISKANISDEVDSLDRKLLLEVIDTCSKKRFTISDDGLRIRAAQGHSININLQLKPVEPPEILYHGTATRYIDKILKKGLKPQQRQYVHLSNDIATATKVGQRYGKPVIIKINALLMNEKGFKFYQAENGVWLTEYVPRNHIKLYK